MVGTHLMPLSRLVWLLVCLLTLCCGRTAIAQQPPNYEDVRWISLLDGQTLSGWKVVGKEKWTIVDGAIVGESVAGGDGFVLTEKEFTDFELHVRFKCDTPGNSGVFYHTTLNGEEFGNGMQVEVDPGVNRHTGGLHEPYGRGWVVWPAAENETVLKPNDWNDLLVKVVANRVITRLNGVLMVDFTDPKPKNSQGAIGFQLHPGRGGQIVRFKDIWIRDLGSSIRAEPSQ